MTSWSVSQFFGHPVIFPGFLQSLPCEFPSKRIAKSTYVPLFMIHSIPTALAMLIRLLYIIYTSIFISICSPELISKLKCIHLPTRHLHRSKFKPKSHPNTCSQLVPPTLVPILNTTLDPSNLRNQNPGNQSCLPLPIIVHMETINRSWPFYHSVFLKSLFPSLCARSVISPFLI